MTPSLARTARAAAPVTAALAAASVVALLGAVDPNEPGHYPTCPFLALTGRWCPGCGSLRALHSLAHGDLSGALGHNVLTVALLPVLAVLWVAWARRTWTPRPRSWAAPAWVIWLLLGAVLVFWVARNLPGMTFLAP